MTATSLSCIAYVDDMTARGVSGWWVGGENEKRVRSVHKQHDLIKRKLK